MCKDTTNNGVSQREPIFFFSRRASWQENSGRFQCPDISSNGGLVLVGLMKDSIARKIARLIPDYRNQLFVPSYEEMVCQRVGQIMCGYGMQRLRPPAPRHALKMTWAAKHRILACAHNRRWHGLRIILTKRTFTWKIAELFVKDHISSFDKAPRKIILDRWAIQMLTHMGAVAVVVQWLLWTNTATCRWLFSTVWTANWYFPLLRPGRRNKSLNIFGILRRVIEYIHKEWPHTQ